MRESGRKKRNTGKSWVDFSDSGRAGLYFRNFDTF